jgi:putative transcriptional regulator
MDAIIINMNTIEEKRNKVASTIQTARVQKGWTQQELADRIGCQRQTILKIEQSRYSPNCDILYQILDALDLTLKIGNEEV